MARRRSLDIHALLFDTDIVNSVGMTGVLVYEVLWGIAEDWGGYEPKYKDIALETGALRISPKKVEQVVTQLVASGKIVEFTIGSRVTHYLVNFHKHQRLEHPAIPKLPLPEWIKCEIITKNNKKEASFTFDEEKFFSCTSHEKLMGVSCPSHAEVKRSEEKGREVKSLTTQPSGACATDIIEPKKEALPSPSSSETDFSSSPQGAATAKATAKKDTLTALRGYELLTPEDIQRIKELPPGQQVTVAMGMISTRRKRTPAEIRGAT